MSTRLKLIGTVILLGLALLATISSAIQTVQAVQRLEEHRRLVTAGDVRSIRPWMTLPVIARIYHVPESYLDAWLHLSSPQALHRASLLNLANRSHRPVDELIRDVQQAVLTYRQQHPPPSSPRSTPGNASGQAEENALAYLRWCDPGGGTLYVLCQSDCAPSVMRQAVVEVRK